MSKILKEIQTTIPMPRTMTIGDPSYFEEFKNDPKRLAELVYQRGFKRPSWKAAVKLVQTEESFDLGGEPHAYPLYSLLVACAPTDEYLETYLNEEYYRGQTPKTTEIGVDTAKYILEINEVGIIVRTGSDGGFGGVTEFYRGKKLEGVLVALSLGDLQEFEEWQRELEYLFEVKF